MFLYSLKDLKKISIRSLIKKKKLKSKIFLILILILLFIFIYFLQKEISPGHPIEPMDQSPLECEREMFVFRDQNLLIQRKLWFAVINGKLAKVGNWICPGAGVDWSTDGTRVIAYKKIQRHVEVILMYFSKDFERRKQQLKKTNGALGRIERTARDFRVAWYFRTFNFLAHSRLF